MCGVSQTLKIKTLFCFSTNFNIILSLTKKVERQQLWVRHPVTALGGFLFWNKNGLG